MKMISSTLLFFLLRTFTHFLIPGLAQQNCSTTNTESCWVCDKASNDTTDMTIYEKNLKYLLSNFSSSTIHSLNVYGFYNYSFGENSNRVNAIALCRGDLSPEICTSCVYNSTKRLFGSCANRREAILWDELCMVRYSNKAIFFTAQSEPRMYLPSPNSVQEPNLFNTTLKPLLNTLINKAASGDSLRKYASGESTVPGYYTIYAAAQCTPDLDRQQCSGCLQEAAVFISGQSGCKEGTRVLKPSCNLRYDVTSFFGVTDDSPVLLPNSSKTADHSEKMNISISKMGKLAILLSSVFLILLVGLACWLAKMKKRVKRRQRRNIVSETACSSFSEDHPSQKELCNSRHNSYIPLFDLKTIAAATCNFSIGNKLGEGGFGSVYKGVLPNGEEIAVKRLSKYSGQGIEEFKNEVTLIAKLQHRNLVSILGCCFQEEEKMLIYEYLPNKSLNSYIFDERKRKMLNWRKRFNIICGIARGILYLHQDSKLRIIHRDLKSSNVLLDATMNPKISDFGLSRIFGGAQTEASTNRVVGTYGYMSPEYAMEGLFSMKSDIYSFGVLVLEIITGKKNTGYYHEKPESNLVGHVWDLWREDKASQLVDPVLDEPSVDEALRCIQIGLLCVEEHASDRPTMSTIVFMLGNDILALPSPKQPAFVFKEGTSMESHQLVDQDHHLTL